MRQAMDLQLSVNELFAEQLSNWEQARDNYNALEGVTVKEIILNGFNVKVQFNPARIVSSAAKVDAKSLQERKCFLCKENRPAVQKGINYRGVAGDYTILINPFPIFPKHLTIPCVEHVRQEINGEVSRIEDMLSLSKELKDYILFYNGPRCGASAPDHMHFQAGNKGFLPFEYNFKDLKREILLSNNDIKLYSVENYMNGVFVIEGGNAKSISNEFEKIYKKLAIKEGEWEPMLNILSWYAEDRYILALFLREKHRPSHFFAEGEDNILLSPASVDMGGVFITPLEKDFNKISAKELGEILDEILISKEMMSSIKNSFKEQPYVSVGIMQDEVIEFKLNNNYTTSNGEIVDGEQIVKLVDGMIEWRGALYNELLFTSNGVGTFWLKDVTIGVNFHWERKENQKFGGDLKFLVENGKIAAVNLIGVEDYLTSVISSEMSATASLELLKAHAVISRSWLLAQIEKNKEIADSNKAYCATIESKDELIKWYDREDHKNFDVCADDHCQRYQGLTRASTQMVREAIAATWGEVLKSEGKICDARFSKCCGGGVEEFQYCWEPIKYSYLVKLRDGEDSKDLPDLKVEANAKRWILSTPDAFCNTSDKKILSQVLNNYDQETVNFYRWKEEYSQQELSKLILDRSGVDYGEIIDLIPIERGTSGRLVKLQIVGTKKSMIIGKELEIRRTLSTSHLYSSAFVVEKVYKEDPNIPVKFILHGAGWGHGVGLCQIGAAVMGEKGYNYRDILLHYYVGANIEKQY